MNSKSIVRRTLPLIIALAVIIILALVFTFLSGEKPNPKISNPEGIFMKSGDVEIDNEQIYTELKQTYGYSVLVDMMDKYLLGQEKDSDGNPYYVSIDKLSEDRLKEIDDRIEKAMFPSGRSGVNDDDQKRIDTWETNIFMNLGLKNSADYKEHYNLIISKENYTRDQIRKNYEESKADDDLDLTITEENIKTYYKTNYNNEHWTIVVPYSTTQAAKDALGQIGIEIKQITDDNKNITTWVKGGTETQLTIEEVKQAFIDLYNNANAYKAVGYPNAGNPSLNNVIREGVHYNLTDGKIVFNTEVDEDLEVENIQDDVNLFHFTLTELNAIDTNLGDFVNSDLRSITNEASTLIQTFSVNPKTFTGSSVYYLVLKIAHEEAPAQSEVQEEVISKIIDSRITAEQPGLLRELRASYKDKGGFIIYDSFIESIYISQNTTHKATKKENDEIVLQLGDYTVTADEFFKELSKRFGEIETIRYYGYEFLLYSQYNTIYEYKGRQEEGKVLDQDAWNDILDLIDFEKNKLASNGYSQDGFNSSYGWKKFLKAHYNVENEQELKIVFLFQEVQKEFAKAMAETSQEKWDEIYLPNMNDIFTDFINASGMHILINRLDEEGKPIDPKDWSTQEVDLAKELYNIIIDRLEGATPNQLKDLMGSRITNEYTNAPKFLAGLEQVIENQPVQEINKEWLKLTQDSYIFSKFKSAGFVLTAEELTITAGQMVEPFEDAVREIWNEALLAGQKGDYIKLYQGYSKDYIVTEFGYHVYLNLTVSGRTTGLVDGVETVVSIPTLENVRKYEEDINHGDLDAFTKKGIATYYTPIRSELTGQYYPLLQLNLRILEDMDNTEYIRFPSENTNKYLEKALQAYNDMYYRQLKYIENPADGE